MGGRRQVHLDPAPLRATARRGSAAGATPVPDPDQCRAGGGGAVPATDGTCVPGRGRVPGCLSATGGPAAMAGRRAARRPRAGRAADRRRARSRRARRPPHADPTGRVRAARNASVSPGARSSGPGRGTTPERLTALLSTPPPHGTRTSSTPSLTGEAQARCRTPTWLAAPLGAGAAPTPTLPHHDPQPGLRGPRAAPRPVAGRPAGAGRTARTGVSRAGLHVRLHSRFPGRPRTRAGRGGARRRFPPGRDLLHRGGADGRLRRPVGHRPRHRW